MNFNNTSLINDVFRVLDKIVLIEKKNILHFKGTRLYPSEIHLLLFISKERSKNATIIAKKFGITKGAVSQTLSRLENKGIIKKNRDPYNKNELSISFTPLGKDIIKQFDKLKDSVKLQYDKYFSSLKQEERNTVKRYLLFMESVIDSL